MYGSPHLSILVQHKVLFHDNKITYSGKEELSQNVILSHTGVLTLQSSRKQRWSQVLAVGVV